MLFQVEKHRVLVNCQSLVFTNQITPEFVKATPKAFSQILHFTKETTVEKNPAKPKVNGAAEKKRFTWAHTSAAQPAVSCDSI